MVMIVMASLTQRLRAAIECHKTTQADVLNISALQMRSSPYFPPRTPLLLRVSYFIYSNPPQHGADASAPQVKASRSYGQENNRVW